MRKTKTVKIDDREIAVKELRVKDIYNILDKMESIEEDGFSGVFDLLPLAVDADIEALQEYAPSELEPLWEAFGEVNAVFLGLMAKVGMGDAIKQFLSTNLTASFADLSKEDTQT